MSEPWPYDQPAFRRSDRAVSPDGRVVAEIRRADEVAMSAPTSGTLELSTGSTLGRCGPGFTWSEDSRYLAVAIWLHRFGLLRRQRLAVVDVREGRARASPETARCFQPESFAGGVLTATAEPFHRPRPVSWRIPEDLARFRPLALGGR